MKFHWADFLEREGGHWQIVPNDERGKYWTTDCALLDADTRIVTISSETQNFARLADIESLEEVTIHEGSPDQITMLAELIQIKRLRITHARPKSIAPLAKLTNVEELVLEYVSGFSDISPLAEMPALRALHVENLRRVHDFAPLGNALCLRYLSIRGTFDWPQTIDSIAFAGKLSALEYLAITGRVHNLESAKALAAIGKHCEFDFIGNLFPIEVFAFLEAHCEKANFEPVQYWHNGPDVLLPPDDPRSGMTEAEIIANHPEVIIRGDGTRSCMEPTEWDKYHLLGRGARDISVKSKNAAEKADAYKRNYRQLVEKEREPATS